MKKVAVILSGSGVFDGAEIHESVLTLLYLAKSGAEYQCFAPDILQHHVVNHLTGEISEEESRNVLVESARIARGEIQNINNFDPNNFDALILPGGFGAAKNLSNFAFKGADASVNVDVLAACKLLAKTKKPAGYACIAPALLPQIYGQGVKLTIGTDSDTAEALTKMGAKHIECEVTDIIVDEQNNLVTTPAYMLAQNIVEAAVGIEKLVSKVLSLCDE